MAIPDGGLVGTVGFDTVHPSDLAAAADAFTHALLSPGLGQEVLVRARP